MTMSPQLMTFTTCFGNKKAENHDLILAFSLADGNIAIQWLSCFQKSSIKTLSGDFCLVYNICILV